MILLSIYLIGIPIAAFLVWLVPNPMPIYHWSDHIVMPLIMGALWPIWVFILAFFFMIFFLFGF